MADVTKIANMINPEVMADIVRDKLTDLIKFTPLAKVDTTLQGRAGDTVTLPKFAYIGDAADVAEGEAIPMSLLTTSTSKVKVKKAGRGVKLTDEAVLSGYGDPVGETTNQLALSIAAKVDNDCLTALSGIKSNMTVDVSAEKTIGSHVVADGLVKFGEGLEGEKVLLIAPAQLAQIRKDPDYLKPSEMTQKAIMGGVIGEIWGCQISVSNKIKAAGSKYTNYIVKPGALAIYLKRGVEIETDRDIDFKLTKITGDEHYAVYLLDESKAVKLITAENPVEVASGAKE